METMFDSVNIDNIPKDATWVAGYVDGIWPTYHALVRRFPKAYCVSIATSKNSPADVLDVEQGDATPEEAVDWAKAMRAKGQTPVVYTSLSNVDNVRTAFKTADVAEPLLWVADWTNEPHLVPGSVATQYANGTAQYPGKAAFCDTSVVSPNWPKKHETVTQTLKKDVTVKISKEPLASLFRQLAAYAGIATQIAHQGHLPASVRTAIISVSGLILAVEHYAAKP